MRTLQSRLRLESLDVRDLPSATVVDLTTRGSSGEVNGAIFRQDDGPFTSPESVQPFLRLRGHSPNDVRKGFNSDARPVQFNESHNRAVNHSLRLGDLPQVSVDGNLYRSFLLSIRQNQAHPRLSLDQVRLFTASTGNLTGYNRHTGQLAGLDAVYDLDAGGNSWVKLNDRLNPRDHFGDMVMLVPESAFAGATADTFVYLYCKFGERFEVHGANETWAPGRAEATGSISGAVIDADTGNAVAGLIVFIDANDNGVREEGEQYTSTDANGQYAFFGLPASSDPNQVYHLYVETDGTGWQPVSGDPIDVHLNPGDVVTDVNIYVTADGNWN